MNRFLMTTTALVTLAMIQSAGAATTVGMGVSATVSTVCNITANPLAFNEVSLTGETDAQTTVDATCTNGGAYNVGMDNGANALGGQRRLASGANFVNYDIFSDNAHATRWGNTVGVDTVAGTGNGGDQSLDVFGAVATGQTLSTGNYADTVQVTVTF